MSRSRPGNLLIRATGNLKGGPTASCTNPSLVPWVSQATTSGTVAVGNDTNVTVSVDATGMPAGSYSAVLCVATNDPSNDVVEVPVGMTVSGCANDGVTDRLFAGGFDGDTCTPVNIVTGDFNADIPDDFDGVSINLLAGSVVPGGYDSSDDLFFYDPENGGSVLTAYWYADSIPAEVGGVVDGSFRFQVLHPGDAVGPGIAFSGNETPLNNWTASAEGYIGIAFYNEATSKLNYGYIHLTSTGPLGFPAHISDYAYNANGGAITIP